MVDQEIMNGNAEQAQARIESVRHVPRLPITTLIEDLAIDLAAQGRLPDHALADATHVACAAVYRLEYLLTWNCRHIAKAHVLRRIRPMIEARGYLLP
jgi:predicted nucleic acid-binding protein